MRKYTETCADAVHKNFMLEIVLPRNLVRDATVVYAYQIFVPANCTRVIIFITK